ncbi:MULTISPECIES: STAS domain-containing protein [Marichromatium]|uniref:Anti-sigma factor antagonist n=1 Tax=Marichromatium gracile TaxID=1048 RepID=A0A4V6P4T7_MARGR|nr:MULTISPECIES: STAS domain-containing protein [Marichromatium]MBK1707953.1 anti-anti-sigma factor [Marichromatium gracile]MBO8086577.1 STAS domain-containing protein [Marichromatium sp.]RNE91345.1 anti-sigma factor antagonist [Marichromatium sp. AB32]TCW38470.1 stage II sporulation protein AA (anti-sigma F factor antagonist) [Marichromatium gracile]
MELAVQQTPSAQIIALRGRLDTLTAPSYEARALALIDDGATRIVLDLAGLTYISSAGLRSLIVTAKALQQQGGVLLLASLTGNVRDVFEMAGLDAIFKTYDSVATALDAA